MPSQHTLAAVHYSYVVSTPSAVVHNYISYHLCDHPVNAFDRGNGVGDANVCARGGRGGHANGYDVVLDRRRWESRYGSVVLRVSLLLLADGELLVCSFGVGL